MKNEAPTPRILPKRLTKRVRTLCFALHQRAHDDALSDVMQTSAHRELFERITLVAAIYWAYPGGRVDDFVLKSAMGDYLDFGERNRLRWSPEHGFVPMREACTPNFLANYERIGPHPGDIDAQR